MKRLVKMTLLLAVAGPSLTGIAHAGPGQSYLLPGEYLLQCEYLQSTNGRFYLYLNSAHTLQIIDSAVSGSIVWDPFGTSFAGVPIWESPPAGPPPSWFYHASYYAKMQNDGDFALGVGQYQYDFQMSWDTGTAGIPGAFLWLTDDGHAVIYDIWNLIFAGKLVSHWQAP